MVDAGSLLFGSARSTGILQRAADEPWLGVQLLASCPETLTRAAGMLAPHEFDVVDLNLGCPVPKVTRRGAGAALGAQSDLAAKCLDALVAACRCPVTAKIRVQSPTDPAPTVRLALKLQDAGAAGLTVHGRVWEQVYSGPVAVLVVRAVQEALRIPVIANGGVFDLTTAREIRDLTGCPGVMVARGAIGNPWIYRELLTGDTRPPPHEEVCAVIETHVRMMVEYSGEEVGIRNARKIILAYLCGRGYRRARRNAMSHLSTLREFDALMKILRDEGPSHHFDPVHDLPAFRRNLLGFTSRWRVE